MCFNCVRFQQVLDLDQWHVAALFNQASLLHMAGLPSLALWPTALLLAVDCSDNTAHSFLWALSSTEQRCTAACIRVYRFLSCVEALQEHRWLPSAPCRNPTHTEINTEEQSKEAGEEVRGASPQVRVAATKLAVLTGHGEEARRGDPQYAARIYDEMGARFEGKLVHSLGYRGPWQLRDMLQQHLLSCTSASLEGGENWAVLDLGCGSGLCGRVFGPLLRGNGASVALSDPPSDCSIDPSTWIAPPVAVATSSASASASATVSGSLTNGTDPKAPVSSSDSACVGESREGDVKAEVKEGTYSGSQGSTDACKIVSLGELQLSIAHFVQFSDNYCAPIGKAAPDSFSPNRKATPDRFTEETSTEQIKCSEQIETVERGNPAFPERLLFVGVDVSSKMVDITAANRANGYTHAIRGDLLPVLRALSHCNCNCKGRGGGGNSRSDITCGTATVSGQVESAGASAGANAGANANIATGLGVGGGWASLVLAADTFIYVGALGEVFALVRAVLRAGGLFAFSTEDLDTSPMRSSSSSSGGDSGGDSGEGWDIQGAVPGWGAQLLQSARFAHSDR